MLGIGPMLHRLSGGSENAPDKYYGRTIKTAEIVENVAGRYHNYDALKLTFTDGTSVSLYDDGQSCCESRYITCDDDPASLVGGVLTKIEVKESKREVGEYDDEHEQVFIEVATSNGFITLCTHNEHNGYYGGFALTLAEDGQED